MSAKFQKILSSAIRFLPFFILSAGAFLRLVFLGSVPGGMHQDEAIVAWNAFAVFNEGIDSAGNRYPIYMADWGDGHSPLYGWLLTPIYLLTGGHVAPAFMSRLPQVFVSVLTLWTIYLLMKRLFHARLALWSLFLLTICPWHIMMSRWGLDVNLAPGFLIFGLYFFIRGLEKEKLLLLSAFFYGLSLYSYALIWSVVPFILALQIVYCLSLKKLKINLWSLLSALLLFLLALPLILFVLVNADIIPELVLPFMTIPRMSGYRGGEIAVSLPQMWVNFRNALSILWHQNQGAPYDILLPWGLFYDIGRIFMVIGTVALLVRLIDSFRKKSFSSEYFLFTQLAGGALSCILVTASPHQINALYIPLVLSQAYGIWFVINCLHHRKKAAAKLLSPLIALTYLICLLLFQKDYYTKYRQIASAYFAEGLEECVDFAREQCAVKGLSVISVEKAAQWPRLLLYTETLPSEYLSSVIYDVPPAPSSFKTGDLLIHTRINYDTLTQNNVYILYFTEMSLFEADFVLTRFQDWCVAVPRN